jgi:hypothetical protein
MTADRTVLSQALRHLEAIRQRADAATPGPWAIASWHDRTILPKSWADDTAGPKDRGPFMCISTSHDTDAQFVAHAREDISFLLAELDRLTKETSGG